jgi:hypothetical protein
LTSAVKVKAESTLDMAVIGCAGTAAAPSTLVLAFPCVVDAERRAGDGRVNHRADQGGGQIGRAAAAARGPSSNRGKSNEPTAGVR